MDETKKVEFKYRLSSDYKVYSVSGFQGTLTPTGDLVINCYKERHPLPDKESFKIKESGQLEFIEREPATSNTIIREVPFAFSINPMQARAFAKWLDSKADEFEKRAVRMPDDLNG
jgi:hypothetical protein